MRARSLSRSRLLAALAAVVVACTGQALVPGAAAAAPGPSSAPEWWFDSWNVPALWAAGADGHGILVSVIDTGVQADIPELRGKVAAGRDFIGNGSDGRTDFDTEGFSHGTAMASIIAARRGYGDIEGLAPGAEILPVAVPLGGVLTHGRDINDDDATALAITYAADHGARILNLSLGGVREEDRDQVSCAPTVQAAVAHAVDRGALVVAASGNSGDKGSPVEEPGVCLGVVSVGSVDRGLGVSAFSSRHGYLTVSAPGSEIPTLSRTAGAAYIGAGTSQATAMVSAALALVWSKYPAESNRQILTRLLSTATDRGARGRDAAYGYGVIDPPAAIAAAVPAATAPNAVFAGIAPVLALKAATDKAQRPRLVRAAGNPQARLGQPAVGRPPALLGAAFRLLAGATVACTAAAVLMLVLALRRRRRRPARSPALATAHA